MHQKQEEKPVQQTQASTAGENMRKIFTKENIVSTHNGRSLILSQHDVNILRKTKNSSDYGICGGLNRW